VPGAPGGPGMNCSTELEGYKQLVSAIIDLVSDNATQTEARNNANETMSTLLTVAAKNGLTDVVDELVNVLLNGTITVSKDTITAASKLANEAGFQEVVEILKNNELNGSKPKDEKDARGNTALYRASQAGDQNKVKLLIKEYDVDVNSQGEYGYTPLHRAAEGGYTKIVKLLLELNGVDVNAKSIDGSSPLHYAVKWGYTEVVKLLLGTPDIEVNSENNGGVTSLLVALKNSRPGKTEIVDLLLSAPGINVNARDNTGYGRNYTPLHVAAKLGRPEIAKLLLQAPVEINALDDNGFTPLLTAIAFTNTEIVKMLLKVPEVDVKKGDKFCQTPLELAVGILADNYGGTVAAYKREYEIVELLLAMPNIDVNLAMSDGETLLYFAIWKEQTEIVKLLLGKDGINVNTITNRETPLHLAGLYGKANIVEMLLRTPGVDVNKKNIYGETPLQYILRVSGAGDSDAIVMMLKAAGGV